MQLQEEGRKKDLEWEQRRRRLHKAHAVTGAVTFFIFNLLIGLPGSILPVHLLINAIMSTLFGLPIGYLISTQRGGAVRGALISASAFIVVRLILAVFLSSGSVGIVTIAWWGIVGIIPGALIGIHVEMDE
ncbi:MAG: hypothetical protein HYY36_07920 [Gammaproteobacteria bacterium]|nr:hypothetical protein [Gammaproteobacteria bacterium]